MTEQKDIPLGKLKRSSIIGITSAKAGLRKIRNISKKPFLHPETRALHDEKDHEEIAKMIFAALSRLRGSALKAAQLISMEMEFVPEIYRKELAKACSQVPAINRALIRKVIHTQLGAFPEEIFSSFESLPFAAASLGQVHQAVTREKKKIALKVQYPGIADSIKSDMDMIKIALKPTKYSAIFKYCLDEIRQKITEELDYEKEARHTDFFRKELVLKNVFIPQVVPDYCTKTVLATSKIEGLHLDSWLQTHPSQTERDHYGQIFADMFHYSLFKLKRLHADPNIGNYLFIPGGGLGIIDFGCVEKLEEGFVENLAQVILNHNTPAPCASREFYEKLGIYFRKDRPENEFQSFITHWLDWISRPFQSEYFDFGNNAGYFNQGISLSKDLYNHIQYFDGSFTYFGRFQHGIFRILQQLQAKVKWRLES